MMICKKVSFREYIINNYHKLLFEYIWSEFKGTLWEYIERKYHADK